MLRGKRYEMRTPLWFMASLVVTLVVLSWLADSAATQHIVTGTVAEVEAGEWMSVANDTTDPVGVRIALRQTTAYKGSPAAIKPGVLVSVWYRSVGERRPVADKVHVLADAGAGSR
jgi:hypothetical protein